MSENTIKIELAVLDSGKVSDFIVIIYYNLIRYDRELARISSRYIKTLFLPSHTDYRPPNIVESLIPPVFSGKPAPDRDWPGIGNSQQHSQLP